MTLWPFSMIDWLKFLSNHNIEYVTRGRNVGRGYIAVHCPFCGSSDPSQHLNIKLRGKGWRCWRDPTHRGMSATYLVAALLNCPQEQAAALVGEDIEVTPTDDDFMADLRKMVGEEVASRAPVRLPPGARHLNTNAASADVFWMYLCDRGYPQVGVGWVADQYDLHYAFMGNFRYRLIIPIKDEKGCLVSFTARSIIKNEPVRYRSPPGAGPAQSLLGMDWLKDKRGRLLVVCEGPFDAMRITYLGHAEGIYATCLFGLNISLMQVELLARLANHFALGLGLCLDSDTQLARMAIRERCAHLPIQELGLPPGVKDAAEFDRSTFENTLRRHWLPSAGGSPWTKETQSLIRL